MRDPQSATAPSARGARGFSTAPSSAWAAALIVVAASLCAAALAASHAATWRGVFAALAAAITAPVLYAWPPKLGAVGVDRSDVALSRAGTLLSLAGAIGIFDLDRAARSTSAGVFAIGVCALVVVLVRDRLRARWLRQVFDGNVAGWYVTASVEALDARPLFTAGDARSFTATLMRRRDAPEGAYRDNADDARVARVPPTLDVTRRALASRSWRVGSTLSLGVLAAAAMATHKAPPTVVYERQSPVDEYPETRMSAGAAPRLRAPGPTPGGRIAQLALSGHDTCARSIDGTVWCWGGLEGSRRARDDAAWQRDAPGITGAIRLVTRGPSACVVLSSGRARCWFPDWWGSDRDPVADLTGLADISIGRMFACALRRDSTVVCWGRSDAGPLRAARFAPVQARAPSAVSGLTDVVQVSAGDEHVCVVTQAGAVHCWGNNYSHELGADGEATNVPGAAVADLGPVTRVVAGDRFTCALLRDGTVRCWGDYDHADETPPVRVPTEIAGLRGAVDLTGGGAHVCAVTGDGTVACLSGRRVTSDVLRADREARLTFAEGHACARGAGGVVRCWSWASGAPSRVEALRGARELAIVEQTGGDGDACGLFANGSVRCEPLDAVPADPSEVPAPRQVAGVSLAARVALGAQLGCAALTSGGVACWRRGDESRGAHAIATPGGGVIDLSVGARRVCALRRDGAIMCSDERAGGAPRPPVDRASLRVLSTARRFAQLAAGEGHTCARADDGGVWCWGDNDAGQLGDGTDRDRDAPVPVSGLTDAVEVTAGSQHTCARRRGGAVLCWGRGAEGQLGDGTTEQRRQPVAMADVRDAASVAAGGDRTCVLSGGVARCWGARPVGVRSPISTPVGSEAHPAVSVAVGAAHACALGRDGDVSCWGENRFGELGATAPPILDSASCRPSPCTRDYWRPMTYTAAPIPVAW